MDGLASFMLEKKAFSIPSGIVPVFSLANLLLTVTIELLGD